MKKFKKGDKVKARFTKDQIDPARADPARPGSYDYYKAKFTKNQMNRMDYYLYGEIVSLCPCSLCFASGQMHFYKIKINDDYFSDDEIFLGEDVIELVEEQSLVCAAMDFLGQSFASSPTIEKIAK